MKERIRIDRIEIKGIEIEQIESVYFDTINVCGLPVPNKEIMKAIIKKMPDRESELLFVLASNDWVYAHRHRFNPQDYHSDVPWEIEELELHSRYIEITKSWAKICNFDFSSVMYSGIVTSWYETVLGNSNGGSIKKRKDVLNKLKNGEEYSSIKFPPVRDYSHLTILGDRYLGENLIYDKCSPSHQYSVTLQFRLRFHKAVDDLMLVNPDIKKSLLEKANILRQLAGIAKAYPSTSLRSFCCPFCGQYQLIQGFNKTPKDCESPKCKRVYSRGTTKKSREQPHAVNKKLSLPHKAFDIPKICTGCGKKKVIYRWAHGNLCNDPCGKNG
jgi:hypothetical protein